MLKRLKTKFVAIIMVLVGAVLVSMLGGSFLSTWETQHDLTIMALERGIEADLYDLPRMGNLTGEQSGREGTPDDRPAGMLMLCVDLDASGVVIATNDAPVSIDPEALSDVLMLALDADEDTGWDTSQHIAWMRAQKATGAWRVVIVDTFAADTTLSTLALRDVIITVIAMVLLFCIALGLSTWVLRPVELAWKQQRQFVSDSSHELKTPLAVIIANTEILMKDATLPPDSRRWVESTADESAHMKHLVEELLELARTDESSSGAQGVMQRVDVDLSTMLENASLEFDAIAYERGASIEEDIVEGIHVEGDPEWLERLCKILIENACKYSEHGSPITVRLTREGRRCTMSVHNYGHTIDAQDLPHVFDRFYRTDKARSRSENTGGFGLGLAIAKGIATSHGGSISVESDESQGTTFAVTLPVQG